MIRANHVVMEGPESHSRSGWRSPSVNASTSASTAATPFLTRTRETERELPVFTFPNSLTFFASEKDSLRQILTLYNPYEFPIKFRVFSTSPKLYSVVDAQGTVKPGFCSDIIIRHLAPVANHFGQTDKFRIQIYESLASGSQAVGNLLGKKTLEAVVLEKRPPVNQADDEDDAAESDYFAQLPPAPSSSISSTSSQSRERGKDRSVSASASLEGNQWKPRQRTVHFAGHSRLAPVPASSPMQSFAPSPLVLLMGVLCVVALCLPTENATNGDSRLPVYLHLTVNQKLVAAYVLGLLTMVILRT